MLENVCRQSIIIVLFHDVVMKIYTAYYKIGNHSNAYFCNCFKANCKSANVLYFGNKHS